MKITTTDKFWVVTNPTDLSVIEDILFWCNLEGLENQIIGSLNGPRMTAQDMTIYSDYSKAKKDALERLEAR